MLERISSVGDGLVFNGRVVYGNRAVPREEAKEQFGPKPMAFNEKGKDRRNLFLLQASRVRADRPDEANGMSKEDAELRNRLVEAAKAKLKDLLMFVSPTRVSVSVNRLGLEAS